MTGNQGAAVHAHIDWGCI